MLAPPSNCEPSCVPTKSFLRFGGSFGVAWNIVQGEGKSAGIGVPANFRRGLSGSCSGDEGAGKFSGREAFLTHGNVPPTIRKQGQQITRSHDVVGILSPGWFCLCQEKPIIG